MNKLIKQLNDILAKIQKQTGDISPIMSQIAALVESAISLNFDMGGRWDGNRANISIFSGGNQRWQDLAKSTKHMYRSEWEDSSGNILDRSSGGLRHSIEVMPGKSNITITAKKDYAAIHQFGGVINHPGGTPYVVWSGTAKFISKEKAAELEAEGKKVYYTIPHQIEIPARPYITITEDDLNDIYDLLMSHLT